MSSMKTSAPAVKTSVLAEYMIAGAEQHANRVQVIGGARHDVAGAGALVEGVGEALESGEQIVAKVELNVTGNADHNPAGEELKDSFGDGDGEQQCRIEQSLCRVTPAFRSSVALRMTRGKRIQMPFMRRTQSIPAR